MSEPRRMVLSYPEFFTLYFVSIVVGGLVGLVALVGWRDLYLKKALHSLRYNAVYIAILIAFPLMILAQGILARHFAGSEGAPREIVYTNWIFSLAGSAIRVLQDRLDYAVISDVFIVVYAWVFAFLIYFTPLLLLARDDRVVLRTYAIAMMFNYIVLTPFFLFFPVSVSGFHAASEMTPILYVNSHWGRMVTSIDTLNNDFPSGHVSLSVTTFLVFAYAGSAYRRFSYFLAGATAAIVFAVLYLGIHWPADVFAGFLVAVGSTVAARSDRVQMTIDRYVRMVSQKLLGEGGEQEPTSEKD